MKKIAIIGGGAAGLACARLLQNHCAVTVLERGDRLGKKLSSTGNGQGNVTNLDMGAEHYFSDDCEKVARLLSRFGTEQTLALLQGMGGVFLPDARGRVYPASRQASAITDLFRLSLAGQDIRLGAQVREIAYDKKSGQFSLKWQGGQMCADAVVLAAGGMAAPQFGTDGSAYALAKAFGHSITACSPALVQLKTHPEQVRGLKGIRVDAALTLIRGGKTVFQGRGDVLFTDGGLSGDVVFRASSYAVAGDTALVDFLPDIPHEKLRSIVKNADERSLLCVVNNGLGRVLLKRARSDREELLRLIKGFPVAVTGSLGFAYAQVTKGGVPLAEVDDRLMSKFVKGLYFAGEILNVDGECGGYNLQWAFTSAYAAAQGVLSCCSR